jgi:hypothetical protein
LGSSDLVQSHVSCGVEKNPMGLWCRLFKCTQNKNSVLDKTLTLLSKEEKNQLAYLLNKLVTFGKTIKGD